MMPNMFRIRKTADGEVINMGRFNTKMLKRQLDRELAEELGLCIVGYRDTNKCLPTMIFFRKEGDNKEGDNIIKGIENLDTSKVVYVNVHFKKGHWVMKISGLKGDE